MAQKIEWRWECLTGDDGRVKVIGGWIVRSFFEGAGQVSVSNVFIPDKDHEWEPIIKK